MLHRFRRPKTVRVDLGGVTSMDSVGVAGLLKARRNAESVGCRLAIASMSPRAQSVPQEALFVRLQLTRIRGVGAHVRAEIPG